LQIGQRPLIWKQPGYAYKLQIPRELEVMQNQVLHDKSDNSQAYDM